MRALAQQCVLTAAFNLEEKVVPFGVWGGKTAKKARQASVGLFLWSENHFARARPSEVPAQNEASHFLQILTSVPR
jgi:hypothetical protein